MTTSYDFLGGPLHGQMKDLDDCEMPLRVDGGTYRRTGMEGGPAIALFWPDREVEHGPGDPIAKGQPFPLDEEHVGDCSSMQVDVSGIFISACVLDDGHGGLIMAV
jgi:hypothetical protein